MLKNYQCPGCHQQLFKKSGFFYVKHLKTYRQRFKCLHCKKSFSTQRFSNTCWQKKSHLNQPIYKLLMSGNTQRRCAHLVGCTKNTVHKKFLWLKAQRLPQTDSILTDQHIQIDEMESIEHTKLKPLSIPICVSEDYRILAINVARVPAKGHLSRISIKKYGPRENQQESSFREMLADLRGRFVNPPISITTDSHPLYKKLIKEYFPSSKHVQVVSRNKIKKDRELMHEKERKRIFDPMFQLNQRCAMLRSDIRRLTRRSWCTTKKVENLKAHLLLYQNYHNLFLV